MPELIRRRTTETLRVPLSDHEVCERSQALCSKLRQIETEERDFKDVRDAYKTRVSWLEEESSRLRGEIESRVAEQELEVLKVIDLEAGEARFYATDDEALQIPLHVRRLLDDERQAEIGDEILEGIQHFEDEHATDPGPESGAAEEDEPDPYEQGAEARRSGANRSDNPHEVTSYNWHSWNNGFDECEAGGEA